MERRVETKNGSAYGVRPTWKVSSSQLALGHSPNSEVAVFPVRIIRSPRFLAGYLSAGSLYSTIAIWPSSMPTSITVLSNPLSPT
jgi:hypothetical protein